MFDLNVLNYQPDNQISYTKFHSKAIISCCSENISQFGYCLYKRVNYSTMELSRGAISDILNGVARVKPVLQMLDVEHFPLYYTFLISDGRHTYWTYFEIQSKHMDDMVYDRMINYAVAEVTECEIIMMDDNKRTLVVYDLNVLSDQVGDTIAIQFC